MRTEVSVKTRTEVDKNGDFLVSCFSDMNEDGTTTPVLFKSEVLSAPKIIDNTKGKEGELMLSYVGDKVGEIDGNGNLILDVENDDVNKYNKQNENLTYEG
jgi:hypothetical protein